MCNAKQQCKECQHFGRHASHEQSVAYIADILEEKRPSRSVEREHLTIAANLIRNSRHCRNHAHCKQHGNHDPACRSNASIPSFASDSEEGYGAYNSSHDQHRVQTNKAAFEKFAHGHLVPAVIICIADHKSGKDEEEVHSNMAVVQGSDQSAAHAIGSLGKRESFKDVVNDNQQGCDTSQAIQQLVMRFWCKFHRSSKY